MPKTVGRPRKRLRQKQLEMAARILNFDVSRKGVLNQAQCPKHGRHNTSFLYDENKNGVRVFCEKCDWQTLYRENVWSH